MDLDSGVSLNEIDPSEHLVTLDGSHVIKGNRDKVLYQLSYLHVALMLVSVFYSHMFYK